MNGTIAGASNYLIDLWDVSSGSPVWISQQGTTGYLPGTPAHVNITDLFENSASWPVTFQPIPNKTYRVKLAINNSGCGWIELVKNFHFICCDRSADASFKLSSSSNPKLKGVNLTGGDHHWEVYGISPYTGDFTSREPIKTSDKPGFQIADASTNCFFVKHSVNNDCGYSCSSQKFCSFPCPEKECNLQAPVAQYDPATKKLTWSTVTGAYGYVIQYVKNGCCQGNSASASDLHNIDVQDNTPYVLDPFGAGEGTGGIADCYSVVVYAKCPDGSLSMASNPPICIWP
jgi:hypothetical protein